MSQDPPGLVPALERALDGAQVPVQSAAAVELARRYARLLDEPAVAAKYRQPLNMLRKAFAHFAETINMTPTEAKSLEMAEITIVTALGEHSVASDLGPKLLAALTALNMTLPVTKPAEKTGEPSVKPAGPLADVRAEAKRLRLVGQDGA